MSTTITDTAPQPAPQSALPESHEGAAWLRECGVMLRDLSPHEGREAWRGLAGHHYRAGEPATRVRTLGAFVGDRADPAGVLIVSYPVLNAPWRALAWPELFAQRLPARELANILNREVRTISRVVIDPRLRGVGLARLLVEKYLRDPSSPHTEALASMGRASPFFQRAGMRVVEFPPARRDLALASHLRDAGLDALDLVEVRAAARALRKRPWLRERVLAWARSGKSTTRLARELDANTRTEHEARALVLAAGALAAKPLALVAP